MHLAGSLFLLWDDKDCVRKFSDFFLVCDGRKVDPP